MPIYEYQCKACCHCFEELTLSANDPPPKCPDCECADVEKLMSAGCFRPRGSLPVRVVLAHLPASRPAEGFDRLP